MPNLSIVTAIRTSCSLPIIFTPVIINEDICVDGGIYLNFPISYFKDNTLRDILGINIVGTSNKNINNFFDYLNLITNTLLNKAQSINDQDKNIITIEIVDDKWISFNDFRLHFPKEKLKDYIKLGYNAIKIKFPNYIVENEKY
jgi:NTE family protein